MTEQDHERVLMAAEFVAQCAATAQKHKFPLSVVGAEMLKHGYALMSGSTPDVASRAVHTMLKLYDQAFGLVQPPEDMN